MGMFDTIYFDEAPIENIRDFQTKSLDRALDEYRITKDNKLQISSTRLFSSEEEKNNKHWKDTKITGTIKAYNFDGDFWYNLEIFVADGNITYISMSRTERKK